MASLSFIIGIIGNIISILVFTSPIKTFRQVVKRKSTEEYKSIPYITTLLSTSLWIFYGLLKPGGLLIVTVNGAGAVLQLIYVTVFLIYAPKSTKIVIGAIISQLLLFLSHNPMIKSMKLAALLDVGFLGVVIAVTLLVIHGSSIRLTFVGILCAILTIGMYAAPLGVMKRVIQTRSVEFMPFFLSFFLFLNGGVWSIYSALIKDYYIGIPNAIGFVLGMAQLIIYFMYKNKSSQTKSKAEEDEKLSHFVKTDIEMQRPEIDGNGNQGSLKKGRSLPKPSVSRKYDVDKLMKTISLSPMNSSLSHAKSIDFGDREELLRA